MRKTKRRKSPERKEGKRGREGERERERRRRGRSRWRNGCKAETRRVGVESRRAE
jgi:hypothetical protein